MPDRTDSLPLSFDLCFEDLYRQEGLVRLDEAFRGHLAASDSSIEARLLAARANPEALNGKELSDLIVALAPHVEDFIGELFGISGEILALQQAPSRARAAVFREAPFRPEDEPSAASPRSRPPPSTARRSRRNWSASSTSRSRSESSSSMSRGGWMLRRSTSRS